MCDTRIDVPAKKLEQQSAPDPIGIIGIILVSIWQLNTQWAVRSIDLACLEKDPANKFSEIRSIMFVFLLLLIGTGKHHWAVITPPKPTERCLRVYHN